MIQSYSMVLWSAPQIMTVSEMVDVSYEIIKTLKEYGEELNHKYLTVRSKKRY